MKGKNNNDESRRSYVRHSENSPPKGEIKPLAKPEREKLAEPTRDDFRPERFSFSKMERTTTFDRSSDISRPTFSSCEKLNSTSESRTIIDDKSSQVPRNFSGSKVADKETLGSKAGQKLSRQEAKLEKSIAKLQHTDEKKIKRLAKFKAKQGKRNARLFFNETIGRGEKKPLGKTKAIAKAPLKAGYKVVTTAAKGYKDAIHSQISSGENDVAGLKYVHSAEKFAERQVGKAFKSAKSHIVDRAYWHQRKLNILSDKADLRGAKLQLKKSNLAALKENKGFFARLKAKRANKKEFKLAKKRLYKKQAMRYKQQKTWGLTAAGRRRNRILKKKTFQGKLKALAKKLLLYVGGILIIIAICFAFFAACTSIGGGGGSASVTTYTGDQKVMKDTEKFYSMLEQGLYNKVVTLEEDYPGMDFYVREVEPIGHYIHELQAWQNVVNTQYKEIPAMDLMALFNKMYSLHYEERERVRYETQMVWDRDLKQLVPKEVKIVEHGIAIVVKRNGEIEDYAIKDIKEKFPEKPTKKEKQTRKEAFNHYKSLKKYEGNLPDLFEYMKWSSPVTFVNYVNEKGEKVKINGTDAAAKNGVNMVPGSPLPKYNPNVIGKGNPYAKGQCTWYVYNRWHQMGKDNAIFAGDAGEWGASARQKGFTVNHTVTEGAIVVMPPGGYYTTPSGWYEANKRYGHVGIVEKVNSDGSFTISEMNRVDENGNGANTVGTWTFSKSNAGGMEFIQP